MLQSERLAYSHYQNGDETSLFAFMGDGEAMRFTTSFNDLTTCQDHLERFEAQRTKLGYSAWVIRGKDSDRIIGWGGIYDDPFCPGWGPEVGYCFHPESWGQGFGTELVRFSIQHARQLKRMDRLSAFVHPENLASRRVLEKGGFRWQRDVPEMNRALLSVEL